LHLASRGGHTPIAHILLHHGADPAARDSMDRTPSQVAVAGGYRGIIQLLSSHGAD
jgi:ankyrin repeat protein